MKVYNYFKDIYLFAICTQFYHILQRDKNTVNVTTSGFGLSVEKQC